MTKINEKAQKEWEIIDRMLKRAHLEGLITEVVHSYTSHIQQGDSIEEAAWAAIYDWDCQRRRVMSVCYCIGPQKGQPCCPCKMKANICGVK